MYVIITLSSVFFLLFTVGFVYGCVKCIKFLQFKHRQFRNQREIERNPQHFQLHLLPDSVQNFSSFN